MTRRLFLFASSLPSTLGLAAQALAAALSSRVLGAWRRRRKPRNAPFAGAIGVDAHLTDIVRLRGLTIEGNGPNISGVIFNAGKRLEISESVVRNATNDGVFMNNRNNPTFVFSNTTVAGNGGFGVNAVVVENAPATNNPGESAVSGVGFSARGAVLILRNDTLRGFPFGVAANPALIRLSRSTLTGDAVAAMTPAQPMIESSGDNVIRGNQDDALGALTPAPLH